ncbi:MAG TPA: trehalose-phosphatase [Acidimicrobiia bacterium]|nr:trehalose-phosphatase [Acidimicrobiia bacterium]
MSSPDPFGPLLEYPERSVILTDFDGSLAPIVDDPSAARPVQGTTAALEALVAAFGRVGVVSGRTVSFLRRALPVPGLVLAGLYGMERLVDGAVVLDAAVEPFLGVAEQAAADIERALPGLYVERKGEVSCVIHWRAAPDRGDEALAIGRDIARRHGLAAAEGRMALELRPDVAVDKGTTATALADGFDCALFAGDDRGDLAAFDALDAMVGSRHLRWAVKLAVQSEEAPEPLLARADERVSGPAELVRVLGALGNAVQR